MLAPRQLPDPLWAQRRCSIFPNPGDARERAKCLTAKSMKLRTFMAGAGGWEERYDRDRAAEAIFGKEMDEAARTDVIFGSIFWHQPDAAPVEDRRIEELGAIGVDIARDGHCHLTARSGEMPFPG